MLHLSEKKEENKKRGSRKVRKEVSQSSQRSIAKFRKVSEKRIEKKGGRFSFFAHFLSVVQFFPLYFASSLIC